MVKNVLCNLAKNHGSVLPMYPKKPSVLLQKASFPLCSFHKNKAAEKCSAQPKKSVYPSRRTAYTDVQNQRVQNGGRQPVQ